MKDERLISALKHATSSDDEEYLQNIIFSLSQHGYTIAPVEATDRILEAAREWAWERYESNMADETTIELWRVLIAAVEDENG